MDEKWVPVVGFVGYEVSDLGNVRSYRPRNGRGGLTATPHSLKQNKDKDGYSILTLRSEDGRDRTQKVHRLVLEAFIGPCPEHMQACHNNGDPSDNKLENLRWDSVSENAQDRSNHGRFVCNYPRKRGSAHGSSKLTEDQVLSIRAMYALDYSKAEIARRFNLSAPHVRQVVERHTWKHV